jgi:hypothetical protein
LCSIFGKTQKSAIQIAGWPSDCVPPVPTPVSKVHTFKLREIPMQDIEGMEATIGHSIISPKLTLYQ